MKNYKRRVFAVLLCIMLVLSSVMSTGVSVKAAENGVTSIRLNTKSKLTMYMVTFDFTSSVMDRVAFWAVVAKTVADGDITVVIISTRESSIASICFALFFFIRTSLLICCIVSLFLLFFKIFFSPIVHPILFRFVISDPLIKNLSGIQTKVKNQTLNRKATDTA